MCIVLNKEITEKYVKWHEDKIWIFKDGTPVKLKDIKDLQLIFHMSGYCTIEGTFNKIDVKLYTDSTEAEIM